MCPPLLLPTVVSASLASSSGALPQPSSATPTQKNTQLKEELSDVRAQRLVQHHVGRTTDGVWAADISANSDTDVASQNSLEDRYQALEPGAKIETAQFMVINEAELTPTPGDEDIANPQLAHPVLPDPTAGHDHQSWADLMDETPLPTPQAPQPSSSGDPQKEPQLKLEAKEGCLFFRQEFWAMSNYALISWELGIGESAHQC